MAESEDCRRFQDEKRDMADVGVVADD
jgi:hypothetical protein